LIESLKFESVVIENQIKKLIPIPLKSFKEAIVVARTEENKEQK